jgi:uncharacterized protein YceH (UPF0502 family)
MEDVDEVLLVLQRLMEQDPPLARLLPRQPGTKEARYAHTLNTDTLNPNTLNTNTLNTDPSSQQDVAAGGDSPGDTGGHEERIASLEVELAQTRTELEQLREEFAEFRKQFES